MDEDKKIYNMACISILNAAKERISQDRDTFKNCGKEMTIIGHLRAIMIIDEMIEELKDE